MSPKEFLKELLKSLKSGRLNRLLRLLFLSASLYLLFLVGRELLLYYLKEKEKLSFRLSKVKWHFSLEKGELYFSAGDLEVNSPKLSLSVNDLKSELLIYKSLKELKLHFSNLSADRVSVEIKEKREKEKGKGIKAIPIEVDELSLLYFRIKGKNYFFAGRELEKNERRLFFGGGFGKVGNREVKVYPFYGYLKDEGFFVPQLKVSYGEYSAVGSLKLGRELKKLSYSGLICGNSFKLKTDLKVDGSYWFADGKGEALSRKFSFKGMGDFNLEVPKLKVSELKGRFDGFNFNLNGYLYKDTLSFKGKYHSKNFMLSKISGKELRGKLKITGKLKDPKVISKFNLLEVKTPYLNLKKVEGSLELSSDKASFQAHSKNLEVSGRYELKGRSLSGLLRLKDFPLRELTPVSVAKRRYGKWVPDALLTGSSYFKGNLKSGFLLFRGDLKVSEFKFQGFSSGGELSFKGNRDGVNFNGILKDKDGLLKVVGSLNFRKEKVSASFLGESLNLGKLTFLSRLGLSGRLSGSGKVEGKLKDPSVYADFSSPEVSFFGVYLPQVEGSLTYKDKQLKIEARSPVGVKLSPLKVNFSRRLLSFGVSVSDFPSKELFKVLTGLKLKLPFRTEGLLSASVSGTVPLAFPKKSSVSINLKEFNGKFLLPPLILEGSGRGEVKYERGEFFGSLTGKLSDGSFKGFSFKGGEYGVKLNGKELSVNYSGVSSSPLEGLELLSSGRVFLNLESRELSGKVKLSERFSSNYGSSEGVIYLDFGGLVDRLTIKVSGNFKFRSEYLEREISAKVNGKVSEPENVGNVKINGEGVELYLLLLKDRANLVGKLRDVTLKLPKAKVKVNLALLNLSLPELKGQVSVPTFTVIPENFYRLYSPTGVYLSLDGKRVKISNFSLSYVDGWIEFKEIKLKPISFKFNGVAGVKGLVYLLKLEKLVPYQKGKILFNGNFNYGERPSYAVKFKGKGIEFRSSYLLSKAQVVSLKGEIENGEFKAISGELLIGDGSVFIKGKDGKLSLALSQVPAGMVGLWKSLISGNLEYSLAGNSLTGSLELSRTKLFFEKGSSQRKEAEENRKISLNLSVKVNFDEPVKLKGELFWIEILPSLKLTTINGRPVISGSFYATGGEINYMGKKFKVLYGSGTIEDLERKRGSLSILAETYINGYYIYMKIEGSFKSPVIYLTSDPPLTKEQILNLIMTGASPEQIEAASELFPAVQIAYYAVSTFFKPIESKFQRKLGLESFSVEPYITKYGETVAKLTITKLLSKKIKLIGYETTGQKSEYGGSIQFKLSDKYYLELRYDSYYGPQGGIGINLRLK
ncbi:translocation/assembly module TamB domain-containing protein [Thermovibrio sp.]